MSRERETIELLIRSKIAELLAVADATLDTLSNHDILPATGLLDSASLMELIAWYEQRFEIPLTLEEINIENLGTIAAMANFVLSKRGG